MRLQQSKIWTMTRKPIPKATETEVLLRSRRRCCICFGLNRDTRLKAGQIAHLDGNNGNHSESNLAFLCFEHHDDYDSTTSQRKGLTSGEVKGFRDELFQAINGAFKQQVHFGEITTPPADPYAGSWIRLGSGPNSAEIELTPLPDDIEGSAQYFVSGFALWGTDRPSGPNMGFMQFFERLSDNRKISYSRSKTGGELAVTTLSFLPDGSMEVSESNWLGQYGFNVTFEGRYKRAG